MVMNYLLDATTVEKVCATSDRKSGILIGDKALAHLDETCAHSTTRSAFSSGICLLPTSIPVNQKNLANVSQPNDLVSENRKLRPFQKPLEKAPALDTVQQTLIARSRNWQDAHCWFEQGISRWLTAGHRTKSARVYIIRCVLLLVYAVHKTFRNFTAAPIAINAVFILSFCLLKPAFLATHRTTSSPFLSNCCLCWHYMTCRNQFERHSPVIVAEKCNFTSTSLPWPPP